MAGKCRPPLGPDGCGGAAHDLTIREIDAYQSIKIPLTKGLTPITTANRVASVVQGRSTLFRVFVDPSSTFAPRQLSARVTVTNGMAHDQYFAKQMISKASTDADSSSTFQITVPADKIADGTTYSVELVECSDATGTEQPARFPASGDAPLDAAKTGVFKVTIIPLIANSHTPDTSDAALMPYRSFIEAMYPIEHVELSVGKPMNVSYPISWDTTLEQLRARRQTDAPPQDNYYYGFLAPTDTFKQYCQTGCTAGIGYVGSATQSDMHVAMGLAYSDELSGGIMAHELGHTLGRNHAPCAPGNQISGVDPRYPYSGALIGTWGYDSRKQTFFDPMKTKDIMGYCDPKWISDYTYKGLIDRITLINLPMLDVADPALVQSYRVLLVNGQGARWSQPFPRPDLPFGDPEQADVLDSSGHARGRVTVYRTRLSDGDSATVVVPPPQEGWSAIRLASGESLSFDAPISVPAPN